jgi:hypothetical protein
VSAAQILNRYPKPAGVMAPTGTTSGAWLRVELAIFDLEPGAKEERASIGASPSA